MADKPFPETEPEIDAALHLIAERLVEFGPTLGIPPADVARAAANAANYTYLRQAALQVKTERQAFTDYKNAMMEGPMDAAPLPAPVFASINLPEADTPGIVPWTRNLAQRIKVSPAYNEFYGEQFDFITDEPTKPQRETVTPVLTGDALEAGEVVLKFRKFGMTSIHLYRRVKGTIEWESMGVFTTSPIRFTPPSENGGPVQWEFRCRLLDKDEAVGHFCPPITVTTTP